jgi:hypothetical protein
VDFYCGRAPYLNSISVKHIGQTFAEWISYEHFVHIHSANVALGLSFNQAFIKR